MEELRILIIGSSGGGKSTLSKQLAKELQLPVLHLDRIWHATNYDEEGWQILREAQMKFINENPAFIIDGNYSVTFDLRIPHANLIIWIKPSKYLALYRVLTRSIKVRLKLVDRSDMAEEFQEKLDREYFEFLKFVWNFEKNNVPKIEAGIAERSADCRLVIINNKQDREKLLKELRRDRK